MGLRQNIYFVRHFSRLKYFTYRLLLVLVLAPNYKQHILSLAKVRKVCYSLAKIYVKSAYLNLFWWRGVSFMKHIKGRSKYKSMGTSDLC
jgi:hypothetical protein